MRPLGDELTGTLRSYFPSPHLEVLVYHLNLQIALPLLRASSTLEFEVQTKQEYLKQI